MVHALRKKICALAHAKEVFLRPNVRAHLLPKEVRCNEGLGAHFGKHYIIYSKSDPTCTFPPWAFADLATAVCAIAAMDSAVIPLDSQYFDWNHAWSAFAPLLALQSTLPQKSEQSVLQSKEIRRFQSTFARKIHRITPRDSTFKFFAAYNSSPPIAVNIAELHSTRRSATKGLQAAPALGVFGHPRKQTLCDPYRYFNLLQTAS